MRIIGVVLFAALLVGIAAARARSTPPFGTFNGCPRETQPLPERVAAFERPLRGTVLRFVHTAFPRISKARAEQLVGARVRAIILVRHWLPSGWIKSECGLTVWRNSVAVDVYFPRMDRPHNPIGHCNACAHLTFLAALTRGGWTVWGDY
jgi:hypothetical protein